MFSSPSCIASFPLHRWLIAVLACSLLAGCSTGPKLIPVTGSVTVKGKPAEGATILFHPEDTAQVTASGVTEADGSFSLLSAMQPGVLAGKYKVTVTWPDPTKQPTEAQIMMGTAEPGPDLLKGKYASRDVTTLSVEITSTTTTLPPFAL